MDTTASLSIRGTKHSWESKTGTLHPKKSNYESRRSSQQAFHELACQQTRAVVSRTSGQHSLISRLQACTTRRKPPTSRSSSPGSSALWLLLLSQLPLASSHSSPAPWLLLPALLLLSSSPSPPATVALWSRPPGCPPGDRASPPPHTTPTTRPTVGASAGSGRGTGASVGCVATPGTSANPGRGREGAGKPHSRSFLNFSFRFKCSQWSDHICP